MKVIKFTAAISMIENEKYTKDFFSELEQHSYMSAQNVIPIVEDLFKPRSVVDVGCGTGAWLKTWNEIFRIDNYLGIEGPYLDKEKALIPADKIILKDLKEPVAINQRFDLVMTLEVAEHLPDSSAEIFVQSLISLGDIILFSAAIPGQEGTYHINEQYPEYWAAIFNKYGFVPVDCIRPRIWNNPLIEFYYRQNILVFIKKEIANRYPSIVQETAATKADYLARIHPDFFDRKNEHIQRTKTYSGFLNWKWYMFKQKYFRKNGK
ncbi:MAG: methyltransferase domain-containing protein [Bacteroidota bacterium]